MRHVYLYGISAISDVKIFGQIIKKIPFHNTGDIIPKNIYQSLHTCSDDSNVVYYQYALWEAPMEIKIPAKKSLGDNSSNNFAKWLGN